MVEMDRQKAKLLFLYMLFGTGTTIVNLVLFNWFYYGLAAGTIVSNVIAWIGAVLFAFVTNKWYVFESKCWHWRVALREFLSFAGCRGATGLMDLVMMYTTVDLLHQNAMIMKLIVNVFVVILNYIAGKVIFRKK